jgi:hypothetical protein
MIRTKKHGEFMNNINLNTLPVECLIRIIKHSKDDRLLSQLPCVSSALSQIAIAFFKADDMKRRQLFISKINNFSNEQKKINDINLLLNKGLKFNLKLVQDCEELYGLSQQLKAFLEGNYRPNKKIKFN